MTTPPLLAESQAHILTPAAEQIMRAGNILPADRTASDLLDAIARRVEMSAAGWDPPPRSRRLAEDFASAVEAGRVLLGSPALTNIWYPDRPLASCSATPTLSSLGLPNLEGEAELFYRLNMGAGFNLDKVEVPSDVLGRMNRHAEDVQNSGTCERYVGNMAHASWDHPEIDDFVTAKTRSAARHFNISVAFDAPGERAWRESDARVSAMLDRIAECAWQCGDPGIIFPDRYNAKNALRAVSPYVTTAPCAEVGLAPGDTCVFGYVSLPAHTRRDGTLDFDAVWRSSSLMVRVLDGLVEEGGIHLPVQVSRSLATSKRRVGVAICGYADLLVLAGIRYGSDEAVALLESALSVVHLAALHSSVQLAENRGAFAWFSLSDWAAGTRPCPPATSTVSEADWRDAYAQAGTKGLRNSALTALPPSGRSSILLGVAPSIEPFLDAPAESALSERVRAAAQSAPSNVVPTAYDLTWEAHVRAVDVATRHVDEAVSKTINLGKHAGVDDVRAIFEAALNSEVCAMSVYRDASR